MLLRMANKLGLLFIYIGPNYYEKDIKINLSRVFCVTPSIMNLLLAFLARPRGFEPLTLGLEMRGFVVTNCIELSRFVILQ